MHLDQVLNFRKYLIKSFQDKSNIPLDLIFNFLPLAYDDISGVKDRGSFAINLGLFFSNEGAPTSIAFSDQAIGDHFLEIPEELNGQYSWMENEESFTITFNSKLELEIPRITEMGLNRSSFQKLSKIISSPTETITVLEDANDPTKFIWIEASLISGPAPMPITQKYGSDQIKTFSSFDTSEEDCSGNDPEDPNWYLVKVNTPDGGYCMVRYGFESSPYLIFLRGPGTKKRMLQLKPSVCGS